MKRFVVASVCFLVTLAVILLPWIVLRRTHSMEYLCARSPWRFSQSCVEYRTYTTFYRQGTP